MLSFKLLLSSPFRAWFFSGMLYACFVVMPWVFLPLGWVKWQPLNGWYWWHQHEMIHGFVLPFILGFLLTASANWTGESPVTPRQTALTIMLWWLARVLLHFSVFPWLVASIDILVVLLSAFWLFLLLLKHRNYRNLMMVGILVALAASNFMFYFLPSYVSRAAIAGLMTVLLLISVLTGRVVPFFTARGTGLAKVESWLWHDRAIIVLSLLMLLILTANTFSPWAKWPAVVLGLLHLGRWLRWQNLKLWHVPLLSSIHLAYFSMSLGWFMFLIPSWHSLAVHTLAVGGITTMILAFSARVSLGHSGLPLVPPKRFIVAIGLIIITLLVRVVFVALWPEYLFSWLLLAGVTWTLSFAWMLSAYVPIWMRASA